MSESRIHNTSCKFSLSNLSDSELTHKPTSLYTRVSFSLDELLLVLQGLNFGEGLCVLSNFLLFLADFVLAPKETNLYKSFFR